MQSRARLNRFAFVLAALFGLLFSGASMADIYALVEPDGTIRLSNMPTDPRFKLYLKENEQVKLKDPGMRVRLRGGAAKLPMPEFTQRYQEDIIAAAKLHNIDPALVHAVIQVESNYNVKALSPKGAVGLMQVMPATGLRYGVNAKDLKEPANNIRAGTRYLADLLKMFDGDVKLALAGYNAGEGAVMKYGNSIPPYRETQDYVPRVLAFYERWRTQ